MGFNKSVYKRIQSTISLPLVASIRFYQLLVSPVLGKNCRFHPSCSQYALESVKMHGILLGSWLAIKRLIRCHPGFQGGVDYTPKKICWTDQSLSQKSKRKS